MADVSQTTYRGLLLPLPAVKAENIDTAHGTFSQASPLPGVPEPQVDSDLTLQATGTQSASKQLRVRAQRGGHPGQTGAGFVWQNEGDALWRGWDEPTVMTAWEAVTWIDGASSSDTTSTPHAVTLADDQVLLVYERHIASGPTAGYYIQTRRRSAVGVWASAVDVYSQSAIQADGYHPCLCVLPSGRVLLFHWLDDGSGERNQVQMRYTDDDGDTWNLGASAALKTAFDTSGSSGSGADGGTPGRLRAAYNSGEILLMAHERANDTDRYSLDLFRQYASDDLGTSFSEIGSGWADDSEVRIAQDVIAHADGFLMAYLYHAIAGATLGILQSIKIGSAYQDAYNATRVDSKVLRPLNSPYLPIPMYADAGELGLWVDDDGIIWAAIYEDITTVSCTLLRSTDGADSWLEVGANDAATLPGADRSALWYHQDDAGTYPEGWCATHQRGRGLILHGWAAAPGNEDESIGCAYLGGYATVNMPLHSHSGAGLVKASWHRTWLPLDEPVDVGWTATGAGTDQITNGYLEISSGAVTNRRYFIEPTGTIAEGMIVRGVVDCESGGTLTDADCAIRLRLADGTDDYQITVRMSTTAMRLWDDNAGAQVGSDITLDMTAGADIIVSLNDGSCAMWYRARSTSADREFIAGPSSSTLTNDTGSPDSTHRVTWGHITAGATTSQWRELHYVTDEFAGGSLADGQANPGGLNARSLSPTPLHVDDGVKVQAVDGPAYLGDNWNIDTRYAYAADRIYPLTSPSPREKWRSTDETQQQIAWLFDEWIPSGVSIAIHLAGINWRTGSVDWWNGSTWQTLINLDAATDRASLPYTRSGAQVAPSGTAHTAEHYIERDELAGATIDMGSSIYRRIVNNAEGLWTDATTKKTVAWISGFTDTEPASGTASIWSPTLFAVAHNVSGPIRGLRLTIDAQTTVDGYFTIGSMVLGQPIIFGQDTSWGRALTLEPNVELTTSRDGSRRAQVLGLARRGVEFAWAEGMDATPVQGDDPSPDYLSLHASGAPGALRGEVPLLMRELVASIDGARTPVVYLPNLRATTDYNDIRRSEALYGRVIGGVRVEQIQGEENVDEVFRVATISVEEEL